MNTSMKLRDGRTLDVFLGGDPKGFPLVMHHGTPADSTTFAVWDADCRARDLRLICASRPGYATSTRRPGRAVTQAAADTAEILDQLKLRKFVTVGWSGGGPHALACAALLPDRCTAVATLAGVGPGRWLAQAIPGAAAKMVPGHGHISLVTQYRPAILEGLHPRARETRGRA